MRYESKRALRWRRLAVIAAAVAVEAAAQTAAARRLVPVEAPQHEPLFLDAESVARSGGNVAFKYLLDLRAPQETEANAQPMRSNEIEASIDCAKRTVTVRRLVLYSGPRGTGTPVQSRTFTPGGFKPQPIEARTTFAYLEAHLCRAS